MFAAGYAAYFGSACEFMSHQIRLIPKTIEVKSAVGIGMSEDDGFGLVVDLDVKVEGLSQEDSRRWLPQGTKRVSIQKRLKEMLMSRFRSWS